jgi:hypothetical protein
MAAGPHSTYSSLPLLYPGRVRLSGTEQATSRLDHAWHSRSRAPWRNARRSTRSARRSSHRPHRGALALESHVDVQVDDRGWIRQDRKTPDDAAVGRARRAGDALLARSHADRAPGVGLQRLRSERTANTLKRGGSESSARRQGRHSTSNVPKTWRRVLRLARGGPITYVAAQLGHTKPTTGQHGRGILPRPRAPLAPGSEAR